jgi:hypothetical protein
VESRNREVKASSARSTAGSRRRARFQETQVINERKHREKPFPRLLAKQAELLQRSTA